MDLTSLLKQYKSLDRTVSGNSATSASVVRDVSTCSATSNSSNNNQGHVQGQFKTLCERLEKIRASHSAPNGGDYDIITSQDAEKGSKRQRREAYEDHDKDKDNEESNPQIALLFCIIDEFPNELIWRMWLHGHESKYRFYFHAKFPDRVRSPFVKNRMLRFSYRPQWGSYKIVKAMLALLKESVKHGPRSLVHFCFASESCIPVVDASKVLTTFSMDYSTSCSESWVNYKWKANNGYAQESQFDVLNKGGIPRDCICKADQWCMLSRKHAFMVLSLQDKFLSRKECDSLERLFSKVIAPDEMYIPVVMALLGIIDKGCSTTTDTRHQAADASSTSSSSSSSSHQVKQRRITYVDWTENSKNPKEYVSFPKNYDEISRSGCLFMRKIKMTTADLNKDGDISFINGDNGSETSRRTCDSNISSSSSSGGGRRRETEGHVLEGWIHFMAMLQGGSERESKMQVLMKYRDELRDIMNTERQEQREYITSQSSLKKTNDEEIIARINNEKEDSQIQVHLQRAASNISTISDNSHGGVDNIQAEDDKSCSNRKEDVSSDIIDTDSPPTHKRVKSDENNPFSSRQST